MAEEAQPALNPRDPPSGLCNAVIVARPFAPFIMRWIESYRTFDKGLWATHSVAKPWDLARQHPNEITVLNHKAFFYPLWSVALPSAPLTSRGDADEGRTGTRITSTWSTTA